MPVFRFDIALKIIRGMKAFLRMEGGITRNPAPGHQLQGTGPKGKRRGAEGKQKAPPTDGNGRRVPHPANDRRAENALSKRPSEEVASGDTAPRSGGALPDFVIIEAQKSGTSSLFHLLRQHPYVRTSKKKEVHYFDINFDKDTDWYKSHFPSPTSKEGKHFEPHNLRLYEYLGVDFGR